MVEIGQHRQLLVPRKSAPNAEVIDFDRMLGHLLCVIL
jgi:hypothetical protein